MWRHLFLRIVDALGNHDEYFQTRFDVADIMSLSPLQKCTITICVLAYKSPASNVDYYVQIGETTARECLETFVRGVNQNFGIEYLRRPNNNNTQYLLKMGEAHGFLDMLGLVDCTHWEWKNCLVAWKGQFTWDDHGKPTIMLEATTSHDFMDLTCIFWCSRCK